MRAGLLSDPRVVHLLQTQFIPCMISALNTTECLRDPCDAETLERYVDPALDDFDGGEREAFVLPNGVMRAVFMSLPGDRSTQGYAHYTRDGRRSEAAVGLFREHAAAALRRLEGVPEDWDAVWSGDHPAVRKIAATAPRWPIPSSGAALRVFVRNSYRMYDDLSGCDLVPLSPAEIAAWTKDLDAVGASRELPVEVFRRLVCVMVPRALIAPQLADGSIGGSLRLVVEAVDEQRIRGRVAGTSAMTPTEQSEVGMRSNAACRFRSKGAIHGVFEFDRATSRFAKLRAATAAVDFEWLPRLGGTKTDFPPRHAVALEWVAAEPAASRPHFAGEPR